MSLSRPSWPVRDDIRTLFSDRRPRIAITVGPAAVWLSLFVLLPLFFLVVVSFTTTNERFDIVWEPTLVNYRTLLFREGLSMWETPFARSLVFSYKIATATTVLSFLVSFPVAYLLARRSGRFVRVTLFFLLVPFFSIYIVRIYAWFTIFGNGGAANSILLASGLISEPLEILGFGTLPTLVSLTHAFVPYMLLTMYANLDGVDFTLVDAARDLGASSVGAFKDIVLPLVSSGIVAGSVFVFIPSLGAFVAPEILGQGQFIMFGQMIVDRIHQQYSIGYGSAVAMFIGIAVIVTFVAIYRVSGIEEFVDL